MKPGETAEETAVREVGEELGLTINEPKITGTYWFDKKDMIMIGFLAETHKTDFKTFRRSGLCPLDTSRKSTYNGPPKR